MKTALITGASSGIGRDLSYLFARDNINLVIVARSEDELQHLKNELEAEYGISVLVITKDLSQKDSAADVFEEVNKHSITLDYLVNNAGVGDYKQFEKADLHKLQQMMFLNMNTLTELTHYFLPHIIQRKGHILNLGSVASFMPGPMMAVYYATKNYVLAFGEALDEELSQYEGSVTTVCPGMTQSGFSDKAEMNQSKLLTMGMATSKEVAEFAYRKMMDRKRIAVHGTVNKIFTILARSLPSKMATKIIKKVSEQQ